MLSWSWPLAVCKPLLSLLWCLHSESNKAISSKGPKALLPHPSPPLTQSAHSWEFIPRKQSEWKPSINLHKYMHGSLSLKVKSWEPKQGSGFKTGASTQWAIKPGKPQLWNCREWAECFYYTSNAWPSRLTSYSANYAGGGRGFLLMAKLDSNPQCPRKWGKHWKAAVVTTQ